MTSGSSRPSTQSLRESDRRPVPPPRRRAPGARRLRATRAGARPRGPSADRPAARPATLHPRPLPWSHFVGDDGSAPVYVGRLGLTDRSGHRLLVDWRSPAAEPFFAASHADPMGLASRRRYRWARGRVSDYWDEVFAADGFRGHAAPRRPVRLHREPGRQPLAPDAGRPRHHRGRPGRDHPGRVARRARRRRRTGHREDRRGPAPRGVPALLRPPARRAARRRARHRAAPALPGVRRRCAARPGRGGRADLHPARPPARGCDGRATSPTRRWPGSSPPPTWWQGDRAGGPAVRGAADARAWRSRPPGAMSGSAPADWEEAFESLEPGTRTTRPRRGLGGAAHHSSWTRSRTTRAFPAT